MRYMATDILPAVHPGEILADELVELRLSARKFADHIGVPPNAVTAILHGDRSVTAEMAMRLGKAFATGELFWMNLQRNYDAKIAREKMRGKIAEIEPLVSDRDGA